MKTLKNFVVYIHTVGGKEQLVELQARSRTEVFEKVYQNTLFYDIDYKNKSYRINLSHIVKVIAVEVRL